MFLKKSLYPPRSLDLFVTSIGASFKVDCAKGNFRFVTYADSLNNSTKTLDQHKIIIDVNEK